MELENRGKRRSQIYNHEERVDDELYFAFKECLRSRLRIIKDADRNLYTEIMDALRGLFLPQCKISYRKLYDIIEIMEKDPTKVITFKTLFDLTVKMEQNHNREDIVWGWTDRTPEYNNYIGIYNNDHDAVVDQRNQKIAYDSEMIDNMKEHMASMTGNAILPNASISITQQMYNALTKLDDATLCKIERYFLAIIPADLKNIANGEEKCRPTMRTIYTLDRIYGQAQRIALEEKLDVTKLSGTEKDSKHSYSFGDIMRIANYTGISPHWLFACDTCLGDGAVQAKSGKEENKCKVTVFSDNPIIERIMDVFTLMGNKQKAMLAYAMQIAMMNA